MAETIALTAPTPRYKIGDTFWVATTVTETETFPCPDCLGTKTWKVTTPAGAELTTDCARCSGGYSGANLPSLSYRVVKAGAAQRLITGLEISGIVNPHWREEAIRYRCNQNGGSCWVVNESEAFETEAAALAVATVKAAEENAKLAAKPEAIAARHVATLIYLDARFDHFKNGIWDAWYSYRRLRDDVEECLGDDVSNREVKELVREKLSWENTHRDVAALEAVVRAAELVAQSDDARTDILREALAKLPAFTRSALCGAPLAEVA